VLIVDLAPECPPPRERRVVSRISPLYGLANPG